LVIRERKKPSKQEFFVPAGTDLGVKLLAAKSVLAGTKNTRWEGFLLAKHKHITIPTMMEQFAPTAAWF
jgi:hypothetical protein